MQCPNCYLELKQKYIYHRSYCSIGCILDFLLSIDENQIDRVLRCASQHNYLFMDLSREYYDKLRNNQKNIIDSMAQRTNKENVWKSIYLRKHLLKDIANIIIQY